MMSKKSFVALATYLRGTKPARVADEFAAGRMQQWEEMVRATAIFCRGQNPRFDRGRFLAACGLEEA